MTGSIVRQGRTAPVVGVVLAVALVLAGAGWLVSSGGPDEPTQAATGPALENDELVLAELDPSGLPTEAQLVSTMTARGGDERVVEDPASTVNVGYLNRRGSPQTADGVVLVEVGGTGTTRAVTEATFDRPLPVALHAQYSLDGTVVAPEAVPGATGRLGVRYTVTNTTAEQQTLRYQDASGSTVRRQAPVFVPLAGTMEVRVPDGLDVVEAPGATRTTDAAGHRLLRYSLLLAPPLGSFQTDVFVVLQAVSAVGEAANAGATPQVTLALEPTTSATEESVGFSAEALAGAADGNTELAEGLREIGDETGRLAQGSAAVADGAGAIAAGAGSLAQGIGGALLRGGRQLEGGAAELASGAAALEAAVGQAGASAAQLASGLGALSAGLGELSAGLGQLGSTDGLARAVDGAGELSAAAGQIADQVGSAADGPWPDVLPELPDLPDELTPDELTPDRVAEVVEQYLADLTQRVESVPDPTLVQSIRALEQTSVLLAKVSAVLVRAIEEQKTLLDEATASAASASEGAASLLGEVCGSTPTLTPEQCARLDSVGAQARAASDAAAAAAVSAAGQAVLAGALGLGTGGVGQALGLLETAVTELSDALRSGDAARPGLVEGLALLESGLEESLAAVGALSDAAQAAASGSAELAAGGEALAAGVGQATAGVGSLSDGADALAEGTSANLAGVVDLAAGADELADGARRAAEGSEGVAAAVDVLKRDGIDAVADAVAEAVDDPAFAAAWVAANDARAADALPYGAPEDAVGHVAYRFTMPGTSADTTPAWQWWLAAAIGGVLVSMLAVRRLRAPDEA